jgi:hypothetical protein
MIPIEVILLCLVSCSAFSARPAISTRAAYKLIHRTFSTQRHNFFQDLIQSAFDNDRSLSSVDKRKGMLEGPNFVESSNSVAELTEVQRAWRDRQKGAPLTRELLPNKVVSLDLFLAGVPSRDPSNDLYGSRVNISTRNKQLGLDLPKEPNCALELEFLSDGTCRCSKSAFTTGENLGQWKLSEDGTQLRFSLDCLGFSRTVQTKGSIERIFWSDRPEMTLQTSSEYSIPSGWMFGDVSVGYGTRIGTLNFKSVGVFRIEKKVGLLGAASKLVACGTFQGKFKNDDV